MSTDYGTTNEQVSPEPRGADIDDEAETLRAEIERQLETIGERLAEARELAAQIKALRDEIDDKTAG